MTPSRHRLLALVAVLVALSPSAILAAPAGASSGSPVISDCNANGKLTRTYSTAALQNALATMPPSIKEYTNCYDVIQKALLAGVGHPGSTGNSGSSSSGSSFLPTWLIVVIVVALLAAATLAAVAARRRRNE